MWMNIFQRINSNSLSRCFSYTSGTFTIEGKHQDVSRWSNLFFCFSRKGRNRYDYFSNQEQVKLFGANFVGRAVADGHIVIVDSTFIGGLSLRAGGKVVNCRIDIVTS